TFLLPMSNERGYDTRGIDLCGVWAGTQTRQVFPSRTINKRSLSNGDSPQADRYDWPGRVDDERATAIESLRNARSGLRNFESERVSGGRGPGRGRASPVQIPDAQNERLQGAAAQNEESSDESSDVLRRIQTLIIPTRMSDLVSNSLQFSRRNQTQRSDIDVRIE